MNPLSVQIAFLGVPHTWKADNFWLLQRFSGQPLNLQFLNRSVVGTVQSWIRTPWKMRAKEDSSCLITDRAVWKLKLCSWEAQMHFLHPRFSAGIIFDGLVWYALWPFEILPPSPAYIHISLWENWEWSQGIIKALVRNSRWLCVIFEEYSLIFSPPRSLEGA